MAKNFSASDLMNNIFAGASNFFWLMVDGVIRKHYNIKFYRVLHTQCEHSVKKTFIIAVAVLGGAKIQ